MVIEQSLVPLIIKYYTIDGLSSPSISKLLHISITAVIKNLRKNNIAIIKRKYPIKYNHNSAHKHVFTETDIKEIIRLYTIERLPSTEIGKRFGVSFPVIIRCLYENNTHVRDCRKEKDYLKNRITNTEMPQIITNTKRENGRLTGEVTCPICKRTRRLQLTRPRIKDIVNSKGRCQLCSHTTLLDINTIRPLYIEQKMTTLKIGRLFNVSDMTIRQLLKDNNIPMRQRGELHKLKIANKGTLEHPMTGDICRGTDIELKDAAYYEYIACPKCHKTRWVCRSHIQSHRSLLCITCATDPTINNKGTIESPCVGDIRRGNELHKNKNGNRNFYQWVSCPKCHNERWESAKHVAKHPLCITCSSIIRGLNHRGEKSPAWKGGLSLQEYPADFNNRLKEQIRKRDNYTCQLCGTRQNGTKLAIHHIDYLKDNIHPNNLISLCPPRKSDCHLRTNGNRKYWTEYFTNLLKSKGLYITEGYKISRKL